MERYDFDTKGRPMSLSCGHTMCLNCINLMPVKMCPSCRAPITSQVPNYTLRDAMQAFAASASASLKSPTKVGDTEVLQVVVE